MRHFSLLLLSLFALALARAATPAAPVDLGQGLSYLRMRSLGDDAAALAALKPGALVLDLRHASANAETTTGFAAALAKLKGNDPVIVLVSPATPRVLAAELEKSPTRLLVLGTADAQPTPTVAIETTAEADRAAYDAFETGTPLEKLITGKIEKERYDEATLVAEFKSGQSLPVSEDSTEPALSPQPEATPSAPAATPAKPTAPATDRVLQRAIHLHRGLLALRR